MRSTMDFQGGNMAPLVDKMIGDAFKVVKAVYDNIEAIKYVAYNMQAVVSLAQRMQDLETRVGQAEADIISLKNSN